MPKCLYLIFFLIENFLGCVLYLFLGLLHTVNNWVAFEYCNHEDYKANVYVKILENVCVLDLFQQKSNGEIL